MEPTIEQLEARSILGISAQVTIAEIGDTVGRLVPGLMAAAGGAACGPVISRWHEWTGAGGRMEVAVPVSGTVEPAEHVTSSELPAGPAAVFEHVGPYDGLTAAWQQAHTWIAEHGHATAGAPWEEYVSDCSQAAPEDLVTRIVIPLT